MPEVGLAEVLAGLDREGSPVKNLMLEQVEYRVDQTRWGTWRRFLYPNGQLFEEFRSHNRVGGVPWLHYTRGTCPETGKRIVARGIVAIGRTALGIVALGQFAVGLIAIGQLALGVLLGLGQATTGLVAVGQLAIGAAVGLGQFVTGYVAVGQFGLGHLVLAQVGSGAHVWDIHGASPVARKFFGAFLP